MDMYGSNHNLSIYVDEMARSVGNSIDNEELRRLALQEISRSHGLPGEALSIIPNEVIDQVILMAAILA